MLYKNENNSRKDLSFLQDGDIIDGGNYSQSVLVDVPANLTIKNLANMGNCNLTGDITIEGTLCNIKKDYCYWLHPEWGLPVEDEICRHTDPDKVITIESDEGNITSYDEARKDIRL